MKLNVGVRFANIAALLPWKALLAAAIVLGCTGAMRAQSPDPKQALTAAVRSGAMESEGATPFRLTAKYETFDFMGRPASSGTLEEIFLKPGKRKRTITEGGSIDKFSPDDDVAALVDSEPRGGYMEHQLATALLEPGPSIKDLEIGTAKSKERKLGDVSLTCITLEPPKAAKSPGNGAPLHKSHLYCTDGKLPILRTSELQYGLIAVYNRFTTFGGHTISKEIAIQQRGKTRAHLQVVSIVAAPELSEADFPTAPTSDTPHVDHIGGKARLPSGVAAGNIITKIAPVYPESAKASHTSGQVVLSAVISKEGTMKNLDVISAPTDDLAESAVQAVSQWRYKPYLLNGEPTEVETTVTVNYSFGR